jgi:hypothetical protein
MTWNYCRMSMWDKKTVASSVRSNAVGLLCCWQRCRAEGSYLWGRCLYFDGNSKGFCEQLNKETFQLVPLYIAWDGFMQLQWASSPVTIDGQAKKTVTTPTNWITRHRNPESHSTNGKYSFIHVKMSLFLYSAEIYEYGDRLCSNMHHKYWFGNWLVFTFQFLPVTKDITDVLLIKQKLLNAYNITTKGNNEPSLYMDKQK